MKLFKKTPKQEEAIRTLAGIARNVMLYGGSRSGKTFIICYAIIVRACKTKSRHLACRLRFNHAKTSLWLETFPKVFKLCFPELKYKENKSDYYYTLPNGSEIWVGGLDDKERTEKILGKEYSTIYFSEVSQIAYGSIGIAMSRLAEKNELIKKAYFDENPPNQRHWSYYQFILKKNPEDWTDLDPDKYASLLMNPEDNIENIDQDYLTEVLDQMTEKDKKRFKYGEFEGDHLGFIYYGFNRKAHVKKINRNHNFPIYVGMDFNVNPMTAVVCQYYDDKVWVIDEFYLMSSNTDEMAKDILKKYGSVTIIPDATGRALKTSAAGLSDHQILRNYGFVIPSVNNPYRIDRYNCVNGLFEKERVVVNESCVKLIRDLESVVYKDGTTFPDTIKDKTLTHISDALGYVLWYLEPIQRPRMDIGMLPR